MAKIPNPQLAKERYIYVHLPKEKSNSHFDPAFETNETKMPRDEIILKLMASNLVSNEA